MFHMKQADRTTKFYTDKRQTEKKNSLLNGKFGPKIAHFGSEFFRKRKIILSQTV